MACQKNFVTVRLLSLAACALIAAFVLVGASAESTKTVELDIRPGGEVQTFTQAIVSDCSVALSLILCLAIVNEHHPETEPQSR